MTKFGSRTNFFLTHCTYGLAFDKKSALEMAIYCKGVRTVIGDEQFDRYQALSEEKIKKMNTKNDHKK